jgi:hypothetical protein
MVGMKMTSSILAEFVGKQLAVTTQKCATMPLYLSKPWVPLKCTLRVQQRVLTNLLQISASSGRSIAAFWENIECGILTGKTGRTPPIVAHQTTGVTERPNRCRKWKKCNFDANHPLSAIFWICAYHYAGYGSSAASGHRCGCFSHAVRHCGQDTGHHATHGMHPGDQPYISRYE